MKEFSCNISYLNCSVCFQSYLAEVSDQKISKKVENVFGNRHALFFARLMKAEVHEEGSGVLKAVGGEVVQTAEIVSHQPLDQALLYHLLPYQAPGAWSRLY